MNALPLLLLLAGPLLAQDVHAPAEKAAVAAAATSLSQEPEKSFLFIDPKSRANDYVQAFELLRKDKPTVKINLRTQGGTTMAINELTASTNGTLLFVKVPSNSGPRYLIVPIEEILEIAYSSS